MTKHILCFVMALATACAGLAQRSAANGFGVSVGADLTIPYEDSDIENFWGLDLRGEYRYNLCNRFFVLPAVGVQYEWHKAALGDGASPLADVSAKAWGLGVYPQIGYSLTTIRGNSVDLLTGPMIRYYFDKDYDFNEPALYSDPLEGERWKVMWNFGVGFNFSHFSVRGEYAIKVSKTDWSNNTASLRLAYHF
ncbi:MAG: outer membrane beta-barrel protein [Muribaculaceae bacterium]